MSLRSKLRLTRNLKDQVEKEDESTGGGSDKRYLNYWDLKEGEKIKILFVPDVNGNIWTRFKRHSGSKLGIRGLESIRCAYESNGDECPACIKAFEGLDEAGKNEKLRDEAKKWFPDDRILMSCVVLEAGIEVNESDDGNPVKLLSVPFKVFEHIKQQISEGLIDEDTLCLTPFNIKKSLNAGGRASYEHSYFDRREVSDDILEALDESGLEFYDYENLDIIPPPSITEEVEEWLDKAIEKYNKAKKKGKTVVGDDEDEQEEEKSSRASKLRSRIRGVDEEESDEDEQEEEAPKNKSATSDLRSRLAKLNV